MKQRHMSAISTGPQSHHVRAPSARLQSHHMSAISTGPRSHHMSAISTGPESYHMRTHSARLQSHHMSAISTGPQPHHVRVHSDSPESFSSHSLPPTAPETSTCYAAPTVSFLWHVATYCSNRFILLLDFTVVTHHSLDRIALSGRREQVDSVVYPHSGHYVREMSFLQHQLCLCLDRL
jgi:hypothetical protein